MLKKILFMVIVLLGAMSAKNALAAQTFSETITPNKLTIQREDGSRTTIDAFRIRGYNVAQLRTLVQACGGSIINAVDGGYQITTAPGSVSFSPIAFSGVTTVRVQFNVTDIMDVSGKYMQPGEPGWVFLTDYNYNWGSIRDVLTAMGYEIKSFSDDARNAQTSVVIGKIAQTAAGKQAFPTPSGYAGSCPIYIDYEDALKPCIPDNYTLKYFNDPVMSGEKVWIYARDGVSSLRIYSVDYSDDGGTFAFSVNSLLYQTAMSSDDVLVLNTTVPEGVPNTAVSFTGKDGRIYSYVLGYNGRTGGVNAAFVTLKGIPQ